MTLLTCAAPLVLIIPGFWLIELAKIKTGSIFERIFVSYILSLVLVFVVLYVGSIVNQFYIASLIVIALLLFSSVSLLFRLLKITSHSTKKMFVQLSHRFSGEEIFLLISVIGLISIYAIFLYHRAILDSDVVQEYLPIARQIIVKNGFGYGNGFDMNILLKPIGVSVIYAWNYVTSSSIFSETFRLMPLAPLVVTIVSIYAIAFSVTRSKIIGILSTTVFLVMPFNDRFLLYTGSYPDIFYYPIVFIAIYFLINYFETKRTSLLLWIGTGLGVAGLLKAQTLYVVIAFLLILVFLELKNFKKAPAIMVILSFLTPFYILIPSVLANSVQKDGIRLAYPIFDFTQIVLFLVLSIASITSLFLAFKGSFYVTDNSSFSVRSFIKRLILLLLPFAALSSLWYINNLFRFGTLISTSSINLPNYGWALNIINSTVTLQKVADIWHFLGYFSFMIVDPAVMGFLMLIPFAIGLFLIFRMNLTNLKLLLLIESIIALIILSTVVISLSAQPGYNPRDIFVLAPFLAISCALGIWYSLSCSISKANDNRKFYGSVVLISFFGLLNYVQSVYYWFLNEKLPTILGHFLSLFSSISKLSLTQTSLQLNYPDRAFFVGDNLMRILILSFIAGIPILVLVFLRYLKFPKAKINLRLFSQRTRGIMVIAFCIFLTLSVIIIPRIEFILAQGGVSGLNESQLKTSYGALYGLIANQGQDLNGSIVGFNLPPGLAYYLHGIKVFDLAYPANLAFLKDGFSLNSTFETVSYLRQQRINYLLFNPIIAQKFDVSLNFTLSKIVQNPSLANLTGTFGNWKLYTLGPYTVKEVTIPLTGWTIYSQGTNVDEASYSTSYDGQNLSLTLDPIDPTSRFMIVNYNIPKLNLTDYDYVTVRVNGGTNSRVLLRLWMTDETGFDVSYWQDPYTVSSEVFKLSSYAGKTFRGETYIGLESSDGQSCSLKIQEISFVKVEHESLIP
jgi:hypothetical protein